MNNGPVYLGDGVYVQDECYHLRLFTTDGINNTNRIIIEQDTAEKLYEELKKWLGK